MPCHTRMKSIFLRGLLWLYLLELGFMLVSTEPGYLDFDNLPDTNFSCAWRIVGGYYADVEAACQMFHVCTLGQNNETMDIRFLCLNGTVFDQSTRVCERIDEVDCEKSEQYYDNNRELYGNSAPLIIPGDSEATSPSTTTTTTTTTTTFRPQYYTTSTRHVNRPHYYSTTPSTTAQPVHKLSLHHHQFSSDSAPDFRFNPKEINLKLNPDSSPDIKPVSYQQQRFNDDKTQHVIVTTHSYKEDQKKKPVEYEFDYQDDKNYQNYQTTGEEEEYEDYKSTQYQTTPRKVILRPETSTFKNPSTSPTSQSYHFQRSDRPPVNPPLIYTSLSSPAPFTHSSHSGNKRHSDPKIKKSISVSISDQNGKELAKLNNTPISAIFDSYLDYSEEDVTLLPLFEDVPRLKPQRQKRNTEKKLDHDISKIMTDREAADVLRFLLSWYTNYEKTTKSVTIPLNPETITEINDELSPRINLTNLVETKNSTKLNDTKRVEDNLVATATQNKPNIEEYIDEDYQNFLSNNNNKTPEEQTNETAPIEYDYYYEEIDSTENETNTKEFPPTKPYDILQEKKTEDLIKDELPKNYSVKNETKMKDGSTRKESEKEENNDVNSEVNPLYDYIDDNYEPKTYNKDKTNRGSKDLKVDDVKDVINEYVDDNYEVKSFKNSVEQTVDTEKNHKEVETAKEHPQENHENFEEIKNNTNFEKEYHDRSNDTNINMEYQDESNATRIDNKYQDESNATKIDKEYHDESNDTVTGKEYIDDAEKINTIITTTEDVITSTIPLAKDILEITTNQLLTTITEASNEEFATTTEYNAFETDNKILEASTIDDTTTETYTTYTTQITTEEPTTTTEPYTEELLLTTTELPETTTETLVTMETTTPMITEETVEDNSEAPTTPTIKEEIMDDNLEGMIKVIEKNTKSIATTIVMPLKNVVGISTIHPKDIEEDRTSTIITTTSEVLTTITTPKVIETTRFSSRRRGNHRFSVETKNSKRGRTRNNNQVIRNRPTTEKIETARVDKLVTDSSLLKSANPTLARNSLTSTTPLSRFVRVKLRKEKINKKYIFTCLDKKTNNFYSDPRDCRLFHYCSPGYTSTQLVDMKFVCDLGTYYDEESLICSKDKPKRCL